MEPPGGIPPDKEKQLVLHHQQPKPNLTLNLPVSPATSSTSLAASSGHPPQHNSSVYSGLKSAGSVASCSGSHPHLQPHHQQTIEKLSRPLAFDKMEALVREMQDTEAGVPVRQQKIFLTSIPYAFMGYDLIEWLMDRLNIEESEALSISNQLCLHGYFFPVNDTKTLVVKDDSSLYRFQTPYYWPWQHKTPDNVEYAIYLAKRSLRNKQRHALEDYEAEALSSLHKNLKGKWDFISMQAEEQVRLAKERKKGDKIVGDSQERAFWRVHRPPPGQFTPLESCPVPSRDRQGIKPKKKTIEDVQREVDYLKKSLNRTRMKMSQACELLVSYSETFIEYDFFLRPVLPSNPWVTDDITFWQLNNTFVEIPTEKRVKRWAISVEELVSDPTGLQEFTAFLEKEYSHENIRFWIAVNRLRRSAQSQVPRRVNEIYEEFLKPGAPCEINIDGKTMEVVQKGLKNPSRFTFDAASDHIYTLLLKKDCYPRFIRSEHYKNLLATGIQPSHKKRFNFAGFGVAKKKMTAALSSQPNLGATTIMSSGPGSSSVIGAPPPGSLARRRGSDRSLTGSAHELANAGAKETTPSKVPHSHSQSNLSEVPYREGAKVKPERLATTVETTSSAVCPWDMPEGDDEASSAAASVHVSVCPWDQEDEPPPAPPATPAVKTMPQRLTSTSSDTTEILDRTQRPFGIRQHTVDSGESSAKRLIANFTEQRRASISFTSETSELQMVPSSKLLSSSLANSFIETGLSPDHSSQNVGTVKCPSPPSTDDETVMLTKLVITERSLSPALTTAHSIPPPSLTTTPPTIADEETAVRDCCKLEPKDSEVTLPQEGTKTPRALTPTIHVYECPADDVMSESYSQTDVSVMVIDEHPGIDPVTDDLPIERPSVAAVTSVVAVVMPTMDILSEANINQETQLNERNIKEITIPPPLPQIGPMEEEEQIIGDDVSLPQEELSPTTDEYQEGSQFGTAADRSDAYEYEMGDVDSTASGCIAPAPTPAPPLAPLAEIDLDPAEDEITDPIDVEKHHQIKETTNLTIAPSASGVCSPTTTTTTTSTTTSTTTTTTTNTTSEAEATKKKRKKRNSDAKKACSFEEKDKEKTTSESSSDHNTVCPWEDENVTADGTFVKTYATLGYL